jgi:general secretion pathway protein G
VTAPQGVSNWRGPYLKKADVLLDPWGRPYRYRAPGSHGEFDIFTLGRDDKEGGTGEDRDVTNW